MENPTYIWIIDISGFIESKWIRKVLNIRMNWKNENFNMNSSPNKNSVVFPKLSTRFFQKGKLKILQTGSIEKIFLKDIQ